MPIWRSQVRVNFPGTGSPGYNTWHYRTTNGSSGLESATERLEDFYSAISSVFPVNVTGGTDGVWSRVDEPALQVDVPGWTITAFGSGDTLPTFCAVGLQLRTQRPGRTGRGRLFLGPVRRTVADTEGNVSSQVRGVVRTALQEILSPTATDGNFAVFSRRAGVASDIQEGVVAPYFYSLTTRRD